MKWNNIDLRASLEKYERSQRITRKTSKREITDQELSDLVSALMENKSVPKNELDFLASMNDIKSAALVQEIGKNKNKLKALWEHAHTVSIIKEDGSIELVQLTGTNFEKDFEGELTYNDDGISMNIGISRDFQNRVIDKLGKSLLPAVNADFMKEQDVRYKRIKTISQFTKYLQEQNANKNNRLIYTFNSNNVSITNKKLTKIRQSVSQFRRQGLSESDVNRLINDKLSASKKGQFISRTILEETVQKVVRANMPRGPVGGKPLSSSVLTYRTGNFVNSIRISVDFRTSIVMFNYAPQYYKHELTGRNPKELLKKSIRQIVQEQFRRNFYAVKDEDL